MALIRFSNLVNDIRGASGGNVFSRGLAGATVQSRVARCDPGRSVQRNQRANFAAATRAWRSLSASSRSAWNAFAPDRRQGFQLFTARALMLQVVGLTSVPVPADPGSIPTPDLAGFVNFDPPDSMNFFAPFFSGPPAVHVALFAGPPLPASDSFVHPRQRRLVGTWSAAELADNQPIAKAYSNFFVYSDEVRGQYVQGWIYVVDDATGVRQFFQRISRQISL